MSDAWASIDGFNLSEPSSGEECYVGVRVASDEVIVALSRTTDGDVEVGMNQASARRLAKALQVAADRMPYIEG